MQRERAMQHGDIPNRHHVEAAPYVDIFTGDRDVCVWLNEWRDSIGYDRNVRIINSAHLTELLGAVRDLGADPPYSAT
jgi:hypothetical protein